MRSIPILFLITALAFVSCNSNESKPAPTANDSTSNQTVIKEENIVYASDSLDGFLAYNENATSKPAVIVVPEWWGLNDYAKSRARQLAALGYVALAIDMYGNSRQADNPDEAGKLAGPFYGNPQMGLSRIQSAISLLKSNPHVDSSKVAAIGYCFGGSMVLNAAKLGADLKGVVSFHGVLSPNPAPVPNQVKAQVLVCHGGADLFTPSKDSAAFRKQLEDAGVVYTFKTYPNSKHAFTNPQADEYRQKFKGLEVAYNAEADKQSWEDMKEFLNRIFK